jgi:cytochrome P450
MGRWLGARLIGDTLRLPPGPRGLPLLGMLPALRRDTLQVLDSAMRDYGDIVYLPIPVRRGVFAINRPDLIRRVLHDNQSNYVRLSGVRLSGDAAPPALPHEAAGFEPAMAACVEALAERWDLAARKGQLVEVMSDMTKLTLDILLRVLPVRNGVDTAGLEAAVELKSGHRQSRVPLPFGAIDLKGLKLPGLKLPGLPAWLKRRDAEEFTTLVLNGCEAPATALAWIWYLLSQYPATADRIHAEAATLPVDRVPTTQDLERMEFTRMVIQEALRLYPPVPWFGRSALGADQLAEFDVPAGSIVLISPYVMQRHPLHWDHPERFNPLRFSPGRAAHRTAYVHLPFGAGPEACPGSRIALTEIQMAVAILMKRFRLHLAPQPANQVAHVTPLRPAGPLTMQIERRRS